MTVRYPKVLIIGQTFNTRDGGGITLAHLFKHWPAECLAVASGDKLDQDIDPAQCANYYQLGYSDSIHPFPLSIFSRKVRCGPVTLNSGSAGQESVAPGTRNLKNSGRLYRIAFSLLHFLGIYHLLYRLKPDKIFLDWLKAFGPEVIYSQLASYELIRFVNEIADLTGRKIAVHIMDDWPSTIAQPGVFSGFWRKKIDLDFRLLLSKTSIRLTICQEMKDEYEARYNYPFHPFHNPVDPAVWAPYSRKDYRLDSIFRVLYAGRIGHGIRESLADLAAAIIMLRSEEGLPVEFHVQTMSESTGLEETAKRNQCIKITGSVNYNELPGIYASADLLVIPYDFDPDAIRFTRLSMPTKASEYMISGTPVLVYAAKSTALAQNALNNGWACVVTENDRQLLAATIKELMQNQVLRTAYGTRAHEIAVTKYDQSQVCENFRKILSA